MSVGVAISTTRTRPQFLAESIAGWRRAGLDPIVVNDLDREGVAVTKNRSIAVLMESGVDHLLIADDDVHPLSEDSWRGYVEHDQPHLMLCWGQHRSIGSDGDLSLWKWPRGVMLYVHRSAVKSVGGMRTDYRVAHEHADWSRRIHQSGLTRYMFADLARDPREFWHAEDMPRPRERRHEFVSRKRRNTTIKRTAADARRIAELWALHDGDTSYVEYV